MPGISGPRWQNCWEFPDDSPESSELAATSSCGGRVAGNLGWIRTGDGIQSESVLWHKLKSLQLVEPDR